MRISFILAIVILVLACKNKETSPSVVSNNAVVTCKYKISGMTCTGCEQTIQAEVQKLQGVNMVKAIHSEGFALIEFNPSVVDSISIKAAINSTGYSVTGISLIKNDSIN